MKYFEITGSMISGHDTLDLSINIKIPAVQGLQRSHGNYIDISDSNGGFKAFELGIRYDAKKYSEGYYRTRLADTLCCTIKNNEADGYWTRRASVSVRASKAEMCINNVRKAVEKLESLYDEAIEKAQKGLAQQDKIKKETEETNDLINSIIDAFNK